MTQRTFFQMLFTPDRHQWSKIESFLASSVLLRQFAKAAAESVDANNLSVGIKKTIVIFNSSQILDSFGTERTRYI